MGLGMGGWARLAVLGLVGLWGASASGAEADPGVAIMARLVAPAAGVRVEAARAAGASGRAVFLDPLLSRLQDPEPAVRRAAAEALGALGVPRTSGDLLRLTQALDGAADDPDEAVAQAALTALARYPFPDVRRRLAGRALDPKLAAGRRAAAKQALLPQPAAEVRARMEAYLAVTAEEAARGDVAAPAPGVRWGVPEDGLLMAARDLLSPQGSLHAPAVARLVVDPDRAGRFPFLVFALLEPAAGIRRQAAAALVEQGDLPAAEALAPRLDDPDAAVRRWAIAGVAARRDAWAADLLVKRVAREPDPALQRSLREALEQQPEAAVAEGFAGWPGRQPEGVARQAVAWLGSRTSTPTAALLVAFATRTPHAKVAELAQGYLDGRPDGQVVPAAVEALAETDPRSTGRARAAYALRGRQHPQLTDALLNLLAIGQADEPVVGLLRARPEAEVRPQVVALLDSLDPAVRQPATQVARDYQGEDVLAAAWRGLLRSPEDQALFAIFRQQAEQDLLPYWLHILDDDAFALRHWEALAALQDLRDPRIPAPVAKAAAARPALAEGAVDLLAQQPPEPALDALAVLAAAPTLQPDLRARAVREMERLPELPVGRVEQALLPLAKDEALPVRHAARNALHRLLPTVYPSWDPYGRVPLIVEGAAFGAGLMLMSTEIADADLSPWFVGGAGAVLGGATPFLLTLSEDVTLGDAGFFGTYGAWGTGAGLGLGLAVFEDKRDRLWLGVAGETLGVATGALALRGLEWGLDDVAFANLTALETGVVAGGISALILGEDARRVERAVGIGLVSGAASLVPMLFLNRKLVVEDDLGLMATTMVHGTWLGAFAPGVFKQGGLRGQDAALAAAAGQGAGYLAGLVWAQLGDLRPADAAWSMAGSGIGAATLGGLGLLLDDADPRVRFGLLEAGSAVGALTLGLMGRHLEFHENDAWLITLLTVGGAVGGGDFSVRAAEGTLDEPGLPGGMLMGAGLGAATGLALTQFVDVSDRTLWRSVLGGAVLGLAGVGLGQMIPELTVRQRAPFTSVALAAGLVLTVPWAENLDLSGRNLTFAVASGVTLGGLMALTPYHLHDGAPPGGEVGAGALFGLAAGVFGGAALAQRLRLSPPETGLATFAALAAAGTGAGAGLLVPDSDPSLPVGLAQGLGVAGFGTVAALFAADVLKVSRPGGRPGGASTALRLSAFAAHGALHGALIPLTWRRDGEVPGREVGGGVMFGAGLGVLSGFAARAMGAPRFRSDELLEASLLTTTLYAVGGGVGLAAEDRRLGLSLVHGLGIPAYVAGLRLAHDTEYDRSTPWTLSLGAASGAWLGAWTSQLLLRDPGARQTAGLALTGAGLGTVGAVVWSQLAPERGEAEVALDEAVLATVGGGLALWLRANDRASAALVGGGSLVGLALGVATAPLTRFSGTDAGLVAYGATLGAYHGALAPAFGGRRSGRAHAGAALVGFGAGYVASAAAAQWAELSAAEVAELSGLTFNAEVIGAGVALMMSPDAPAARATAIQVAGAAGVVASALIAPHTRYQPDDGALVTLAGTVGAFVGGWAPHMFTDDLRTDAQLGSVLVGAGVGVSAAVLLSQTHRLHLADQGEAAALTVAASAVGGGLGLMLDADRRAQAALLDGAVVLGLGLGLGLADRTEYSPQDFGLFGLGTALGTWHGAWLPLLWGEDGDAARGGGALLGAGAGWLAAAAAGPFVERSAGDQVSAGLLWSTGTALGAGVGLLLPSVHERGTVGLMEGLGAAGFVGGLVAAEHLHFSTGDAVLLGAGTVLGAELGLTLPSFVTRDRVAPATRAGGVLLGTSAGALLGGAVSQLVELSPTDVLEASGAALWGQALGLGLALSIPDSSERLRFGLMDGLGAAGLAAGLILAPRTEYGDGALATLSFSTLAGAGLGALTPVYWSGKRLKDAPAQELGGSALLGAAAGLGAGVLLDQVVAVGPEGRKHGALGAALGGMTGAGFGLLLSRDDRVAVALTQGLAAAGAAGVGPSLRYFDFKPKDLALGSAYVGYLTWHGMGLTLLLDGTDRQAAGVAVGTVGLGALTGMYLAPYIDLDLSDTLMLLAGNVWGTWIGGWGGQLLEDALDEDLTGRRQAGLTLLATVLGSDVGLALTGLVVGGLLDVKPTRFAYINLSGLGGMLIGMLAAGAAKGEPLKAGNVIGSLSGLVVGAVVTSFFDFSGSPTWDELLSKRAPAEVAPAAGARLATHGGSGFKVEHWMPSAQVTPSPEGEPMYMFTVSGVFR